MPSPNFALLHTWASQLRAGIECDVRVKEPQFEHGGLVVDLSLDRVEAQVSLWHSGLLDLCVMSVDPGRADVIESHAVKDDADLTRLLERVDSLIRSAARDAG